MPPPLDESALDRFRVQLLDDLRRELQTTAIDLRGEIHGRAADLRQAIEASAAGLRMELIERMDTTAAESRRHFDVVAEHLTSKIDLVAEGVIGVDQKLDRFRDEVRDEFKRVDQWLWRLEARVLGSAGGR